MLDLFIPFQSMALFSVPADPHKKSAEFLTGLPSPLEGIVAEDEWNSLIARLNCALRKHTEGYLSWMPFGFGSRGKMDREIEDILRAKNIIFERRGFFVHHPKETQYRGLNVSLTRR